MKRNSKNKRKDHKKRKKRKDEGTELDSNKVKEENTTNACPDEEQGQKERESYGCGRSEGQRKTK